MRLIIKEGTILLFICLGYIRIASCTRIDWVDFGLPIAFMMKGVGALHLVCSLPLLPLGEVVARPRPGCDSLLLRPRRDASLRRAVNLPEAFCAGRTLSAQGVPERLPLHWFRLSVSLQFVAW
jgi:hypothetical protein